jgi:hypothetical protein
MTEVDVRCTVCRKRFLRTIQQVAEERESEDSPAPAFVCSSCRTSATDRAVVRSAGGVMQTRGRKILG